MSEKVNIWESFLFVMLRKKDILYKMSGMVHKVKSKS